MNSNLNAPELVAANSPRDKGERYDFTTFDRDNIITGRRVSLAWPELVGLLRNPPTRASKKACPLMRVGAFAGDSRAAGSTLESVGAVLGDYDGNVATLAEAARRLREAGVRAAIYSSATSGVVDAKKNPHGGPRWRVVAPLAAPIGEDEHEALVSLLNGAFGGVLGRESWDWTRCYYFGRVAGVAYGFEEIDGVPLDIVALCPSFDPVGPPRSAAKKTAKLTAPRRASDGDSAEVAYLAACGWLTGGHRCDGGVNVRCPRAEMHTADTGPSSTSYFPAGLGGREVGGFKCQHTSCESPSTEAFFSATGLDALHRQRVVNEFAVIETAVGEVALPVLDRKRSGKAVAERNGLEAVLLRPDLCGMHLRFDNFANRIMWAPVSDPAGWRPFSETDRTALCLRLEQGPAGFERISTELAREMVRFIAEQSRFDSAQHWLSGLVWDGTARVHSFIHAYLRGADTPYVRAVSAYLLTALAGRVLEPGIKADMVPVFVGRQGAGKSSVVAALAPSASQFLELDFAKGDDNLLREMCGKLVVELGELRGLRTREQNDLKQFLSRRVDSWIPKYVEGVCGYWCWLVFVGTTNQPKFLSDDTGHRRWLPVEVAGHPSPQAVAGAAAAVAAVRDQLWAEAAAIFQTSGIAWADAEHLAKPEHARFEAVEPWEQAIARWLADDALDGMPRGAAPFSTEDVLAGAVGIELKQITDAHRKRVAAVLRRMGCADKREQFNGARSTFWRRRG